MTIEAATTLWPCGVLCWEEVRHQETWNKWKKDNVFCASYSASVDHCACL